MSDQPVRLSRQELFDLVWSVPMTKLAGRFGISDVALSKACHRHEIPTPGRGHWAKLAAGQRPRRPKLPQPEDARPLSFGDAAGLHSEIEKPDPPVVEVTERLKDPHSAVVWLADALEKATPDKHGRLTAGYSWSPHVLVTKQQTPRALLILDAFIKALVARGHRVDASARGDSGQRELTAFVLDDDFLIELEERLDRKPHELTSEERERQQRWSGKRFPKYDYFPAGHLVLRFSRTHYKYTGRKTVADTKLRRLDGAIGQLVVALEQAAELAAAEARECRRAQDEREAAERRRLRGQRLSWYRVWLAEDLQRMAADWETARRMTDFIAAYEQALPTERRTTRDAAWLESARAYATRTDPLSRLGEVAKDLEPTDEELEELVAKHAPPRTTPALH